MTQPLDSRRWQQIRELFEASLDVDTSSRATWLDHACGADASLRAEVQRLLDADRHGGAQLETPIDAAAALGEDHEQIPIHAHGTTIGNYVIDKELARGGMGVVYLAWDSRLERRVALKALSPALPAGMQARERLQREAKAAGRVSHESVATIYALEAVDDELFIVSEYVPGQTLRGRLASGRLPLREAVEILLGVARGLAAAHDLGVVHRDLKPENVMLTPAGRVKVVDFGIASVDGATRGITRTGMILGTPGYMAPEQINGSGADARSDVFALGVLLYEMVSGRPPFGDTASWTVIAAVLERDPAPLGQIVDSVPAALEQVVANCLAKSPAARYPNAGAVVFALEPVLAELGVRAKTGPAGVAHGPVPPPVGSPGARWWLQFHQAVAAVSLALMMIPAWKLMSRLPLLPGRLLVLALLVMAAGIGTMRLHLWFTARHDGERLPEEVSRVVPALRWSNRVFALLLGLGGAAVADASPELAGVCVACAAGTLVAGEVIEPATIARAVGRTVG